MKLRRISVYGYQFNGGCGTTTGEQDREDGKYVYWTPELQEVWDKSQSVKVTEIEGWLCCPNCGRDICGVVNSKVYSILDKYCNKCGQKLEW